MNPFRWLRGLFSTPASPLPVPRQEVPPLTVLTRDEKLQRRADRFAEMQRDKAVYHGDCHECWQPLNYPPIRMTALDSLVWSGTVGQIEGRPEYYCLECLPLGVAKYRNVLQGGIEIQGTPPDPKVDNE